MKTPQTLFSLLAGAVLFTASNVSAVTTDPVGYTTSTVTSNADLLLGVPLSQAPTFSSKVDSVASGTITVTETIPDVTTNAHYVIATSGALTGQWFEVTGSTSSTVTVAEDIETAGIVATDTFSITSFWTLDTLLPGGGGVPVTSNPLNIQSFIFVNDTTAVGVNLPIAASFFYFDNGTTAGWFTAGGSPAGSNVVSPESYLTIRNLSADSANVTITGSVPTIPLGNDVLSRSAGNQDNQLFNPYPADITLSNTELVEDGAVRATTDPLNILDFVFVYPDTSTGLNPAIVASYFYFDNGTTTGWFTAGGTPADSAVIPAGAAIVIRRGADTDATFSWTPPLPYTL